MATGLTFVRFCDEARLWSFSASSCAREAADARAFPAILRLSAKIEGPDGGAEGI